MKFDENGKCIKNGMHRHYTDDKIIVAGLESRHPKISDSNLNAALDAIPANKHEEFHTILDQLKSRLDDV